MHFLERQNVKKKTTLLWCGWYCCTLPPHQKKPTKVGKVPMFPHHFYSTQYILGNSSLGAQCVSRCLLSTYEHSKKKILKSHMIEKGMISTDFLDVKLNLEANEPNDYPAQYPAYTNVKSNI